MKKMKYCEYGLGIRTSKQKSNRKIFVSNFLNFTEPEPAKALGHFPFFILQIETETFEAN
jgi:hypothetical protein